MRVVARRGGEAPSRIHPWFTPNDLLREKHRGGTPMAIVTFTVRYLDYLKPQAKRYEVRNYWGELVDADVAGR